MVIQMIHKPHYDVYIASYGPGGEIHHFTMDKEGTLQFCGKVPAPHPLYLAINGQTLYAALRRPFAGSADSGVVSFEIAPDGSLQNAGKIQTTLGTEGCHLYVHQGEIYVTNYTSGSIIHMQRRIITHHGKSIDAARQNAPHPHCICPTPDGKYLCVADLGLDKLFLYDRTLNFISAADVPAGHGPRHVIFSPDGRLAYCVNELRSTVSVFRYRNGTCRLLHTYPALPGHSAQASTAAAIRLHQERLYVSNRGDDSITCFEILGDELNRKSVTKCGGKSPRDFHIVGGILLCANELDNSITQFRINEQGQPERYGKLHLNHPLCIIYRERSDNH